MPLSNFQIFKLSNRQYGFLLIGLALSICLLVWHLLSKNDGVDRDTIWELIPNEAIAVIELQQLDTVQETLFQQNPWQDLAELPYFQEARAFQEWFDALMEEMPILEEIKKNPLWVSMHAINYQEVGFLVYMPISNPTYVQRYLQDTIPLLGHYQHKSRQYHNWEIHELFTSKDSSFYLTALPQADSSASLLTDTQIFQEKKTFTFAFKDGYLIGSFTPWLVEDVTRLKDAGSFAKRDWKHIHQNTQSNQDTTSLWHLYVHHNQLNTLSNALLSRTFKNQGKWLQDFADATMWNIHSNRQEITFTGRSLFHLNNQKKLTHLFENQQPAASVLSAFVPDATAYLFRFSFDDGSDFFSRLYRYQQIDTDFIEDTWDQFDFDIHRFWEQIEGEMAVAVSNKTGPRKPKEAFPFAEQLIFIKLKDTAQVASQIRDLLNQQQASPYITQGLPYFMGQLPVQDFPNYAFGNFFSGFEQSHFIFLQQYLVVTSSKDILINLLDHISKGKVWANLPDYQDISAVFSSDAHIGLAMNVSRCIAGLEQPFYVKGKAKMKFKSDWQRALRTQKRYLSKIKHLALTFNMQSGRTSGQLSFQAQAERPSSEDPAYSTTLPVAAKTSPTWVKNHVNRSNELIFQDRWNRINLMSESGKRLWTYSLGKGKSITTPFYQIDLYANGKLQYLFGTANEIHLVDRLGRSVNGFPIYAPNQINSLDVFDYNRTKQYFFTLSDPFGQIYMYNKYGQLRFGWEPKWLNGELVGKISHVKVAGEDYIVTTQKTGTIFVMDKFGKSIEGFPLSIHEDAIDFVLKKGSTLEDATVQLLTAQGLLIKVNFLGKVLERTRLKSNRSLAKFKLCMDEKGTGRYLFSMQEDNLITLFDATGKRLFQKEFDTFTKKEVQYFYFNVGVSLVAVTDLVNQQSYLYFTSGDPVSEAAYESILPVSVHYNRKAGAYYLNKCYGKRVEAVKLDIQ